MGRPGGRADRREPGRRVGKLTADGGPSETSVVVGNLAAAILVGVDPHLYLTVTDSVERLVLDAAVERAWRLRNERDEKLQERQAALIARQIGRMFR